MQTRNHLTRYVKQLIILSVLMGVIGTVVTSQLDAQSADDTVYVCVRDTNGVMVAVDKTEQCPLGWSPLDWSVQGSQGPKGGQGLNGAQGIEGKEGA